jgi:hypothetical protein
VQDAVEAGEWLEMVEVKNTCATVVIAYQNHPFCVASCIFLCLWMRMHSSRHLGGLMQVPFCLQAAAQPEGEAANAVHTRRQGAAHAGASQGTNAAQFM